MGQGIHAGGGGDGRRQLQGQCRVEDGQAREQPRADDHRLEQRALVGEHGRRRAFAAGTGGGRDGEDRQRRLGQFVVALVVEDVARVGGHRRHTLGGVDAAAAAHADHGGAVALFQQRHGSVEHVGAGVGFNGAEQLVVDARLLQRGEEAGQDASVDQALVGDHQQGAVHVRLEQRTGLVGQARATFGNGGEMELELAHEGSSGNCVVLVVPVVTLAGRAGAI
ncbi:hypothetical protein D3C75_652050 [compost metagenome]